jgi:hypothetical protein
VALAVISGAGVVIYRNMPALPLRPAATAAAPPAPAPASPNAPDQADVTSLISVLKAGDGRTTVELARPVATRDAPKVLGTDQDLLFREFARRAVLIALGLVDLVRAIRRVHAAPSNSSRASSPAPGRGARSVRAYVRGPGGIRDRLLPASPRPTGRGRSG